MDIENPGTSFEDFMQQVSEAALITKNPVIYKQTISAEDAPLWKEAMEMNLADYKKLNTWDLMNLSPERKTINGRWTYLTKPKKKGEKHGKKKARWVAKGFQQQYGIDYLETFAHTVKPTLFRLLFAFAAYFEWSILQWNVIAAFMTAGLAEDIYVVQSTEYSCEDLVEGICTSN